MCTEQKATGLFVLASFLFATMRRKTLIFSLYLMISRKIANLMDWIYMNQQNLQMFMLCLRSIYARMTFNCPLMLNKVGSEKIPLPQAHMLFRCVVYRDSYLDTNPKIAIYHDTVFRGYTHPY